MANYYCAPWGNDNNDGTTWLKAKRTLNACVVAFSEGDVVYVEGFYNEYNTDAKFIQLIGVNGAILDGSLLANAEFGYPNLKNFILQNWGQATTSYNSKYENLIIKNTTATYGYMSETIKNILYILSNNLSLNPQSEPDQIGGNHTIYSKSITNILTLSDEIGAFNPNKANNSIIANWQINMTSKDCYFVYSLYINCKFKFTGGGLGADEAIYTYPTGADDDFKIAHLKSRMAIVYGGVASDYMIGCKYYGGSETDIFINPTKENFYLVEGCLAASMSFGGTYIGALPEGRENNFNTDYSTIVNIDSNGKVINQNIDATAIGAIIDLGKVRKIIKLEALGYRSLRNGVEMNNFINLGSQINKGANVLTNNKNYRVEGETIVMDNGAGTNYNVDDRFLAIDEGGGAGLGFDSATNIGFVREINISKPRNIRIKCSKTSSDLSSLAHVNGYITLELLKVPMVNIDLNGEPTYGNLDAGYNAGTAVPLYARYIQDLPIIKTNQLPA
jgi:hypothetical protein